MFVYEGSSRPRSLIPVDRTYFTYFIFLIKNQFLRDGEQRQNLGGCCVLRNTYSIFLIFRHVQLPS